MQRYSETLLQAPLVPAVIYELNLGHDEREPMDGVGH